MIPYGRQDIDQADIDAVVAALKSEFLTQGPAVPAFEDAVARYSNANFGVCVNSATSALHIACLALDVGPGDTVWTTPTTFAASANCALYCGANVDFVDIDPATNNLSVEQLAKKLMAARISGALPKVVIPVHLGGEPCDMVGIRELAGEYGFYIIEDASHAIGGKYLGKPIGACQFSDITVFSFHPVKIITSAEGGMATTNNEVWARRMQLLRSHGITRDPELLIRKTEGPWYYEQLELGFNYRMTDLQAALGLSQLRRLDEFVSTRHAVAERYDTAFQSVPEVVIPQRSPKAYSGMHLYIIRLQLKNTKASHREVFESLRSSGVLVNLHYMPVYWHPFYERLGFKRGYCPEAERYATDAISLPMYVGLSQFEQTEVTAALLRSFNG